MSVKCIIERLYQTLCRDPDTGEGGLTPTESEFHADAFRRIDNIRIGETNKSARDRLVEIDYEGTEGYLAFANGQGRKRRSKHNLLIRIGYFAGDNHNETQMIIGSDDKLIGTYLQKLDNIAGSCDTTCLEAVFVTSSQKVKLDEQSYELQIKATIQIY